MLRRQRSLTRSEQMSRIRGRDTSPELIVRRGLWAAGIRYRLQQRILGGRADLVIPSRRFILFVDGCFWHGCPEHYVRPRSRNDFWDAKLAENVARDRRQTLVLESDHWQVLRVWEHEVAESPSTVLEKILRSIRASGRKQHACWRVVRVELADESADRELRYLQDLRHPEVQRTESGPRSTKKLGRVRRQRLLPV